MAAVPRQPWERMEGEGDQAYRAAQVFFEMGPGRTLADVAGRIYGGAQGRDGGAEGAPKGRRIPGRIGTWSRKFRWAERAKAWDSHHAAARTRASVRIAESDAEKLARERHERDVQNLVVASQLKLRTLQMLDWPMEEVVEETRTISPDGKTIVIQRTVQPARWRLRDAAVMAKVAKELEDLTLGPAPPEVPAVDRTPAVVDEAARRVLEWRRRKREEAHAVPTTPPEPNAKVG
jgi:hypothetical protein